MQQSYLGASSGHYHISLASRKVNETAGDDFERSWGPKLPPNKWWSSLIWQQQDDDYHHYEGNE